MSAWKVTLSKTVITHPRERSSSTSSSSSSTSSTSSTPSVTSSSSVTSQSTTTSKVPMRIAYQKITVGHMRPSRNGVNEKPLAYISSTLGIF
ncbi:putative uncharacterized protein DDB_G0271974 [Hydractinia symbiolongicarpus]|uniref:putative uncharacterized protein DDB_G0271974 n=1 Tax=Hydractinia symbiolongicarpus TaxID=13093 RepID=UPI00254D7BBC|nr:putative uncharacterized protein DDB_G0271974 [Hydractinia symbiolongicarpus]